MFPPRKPEATRRRHGDARKRLGRFLGPKPQQPGVASHYPQPEGVVSPSAREACLPGIGTAVDQIAFLLRDFGGLSRVAAAILTGLTSRGCTKKAVLESEPAAQEGPSPHHCFVNGSFFFLKKEEIGQTVCLKLYITVGAGAGWTR